MGSESKLWKKAKKGFKGMERDFRKSPLARASRTGPAVGIRGKKRRLL